MNTKYNWAGQSLIYARMLAEARKAANKRHKAKTFRQDYADPVYREAINERQRIRRGVK